jgi:hypothetical protein
MKLAAPSESQFHFNGAASEQSKSDLYTILTTGKRKDYPANTRPSSYQSRHNWNVACARGMVTESIFDLTVKIS